MAEQIDIVDLEEEFFTRLAAVRPCRVGEIGTKGWDGRDGGSPRKTRMAAVNPAATWTGIDLFEGDGVDVVADVHQMSKHFEPAHFDGLVMVAVLEHVARPWIAAAELAAVVRPGGLLLVGTHQTFPYHPYPADYWRFTREALGELFAEWSGWKVLASKYDYPCKVLPLGNVTPWNFQADSWLTVSCIAERL